MHYFYIIYSPTIDKFYVGESADLAQRIIQHNTGYFKGSFTAQSKDWELKLSLTFKTIIAARAAEAFVKRMNSRRFIENLLRDHKWFIEKFEK